jgi:hypothetical protein
MLWVRRGISGLLALVLMISLIGLAMGVGLSSAFSSPSHITNWIETSNFYPSILSKARSDTTNSLSSLSLGNKLSPDVEQSLASVFTQADFNQDVSTIISSNYAWLKGQTATPRFNIDLTNQKDAFATSLGNYAANDYASLSLCTAQTAASLTNKTVLNSVCRVPAVDASAIKSQIIADVEASNIVLKNPDLTPTSIGHINGAPYYASFNGHKLYQRLKYSPIISVVVSLICLVGIYFISLKKSRALKKISSSFIAAGLILVLLVVATSSLESTITKHVDRHSGLTSFETSVSNLVDKIVSYVNSINIWFGILYLIIGIVLLSFTIWKRRQHKSIKQASPEANKYENIDSTVDAVDESKPRVNQPGPPPVSKRGMDIMAPTNTKPKVQPSAPPVRSSRPSSSSGPKRRLIQ